MESRVRGPLGQINPIIPVLEPVPAPQPVKQPLQQPLQQHWPERTEPEQQSASTARLTTISETATPTNNLRNFTERLENSLIRARQAVNPDNPVKLDRRQALLIELSEQVPSAIQMIRESLNDMNSISSGIRMLRSLDNRHLQFEALETNTIAEDMIKANRAYIDANHVAINIDELDPVVADQSSLKEILQGIFDNALKYLDPLRDGVITISSHRDLTYTTFMIRDNGRGIPEEDRDHVFEIFQRGHDVVNISGEGLALPYVRTLVRRHHGNIWFESHLDQGTVFYFTVANDLPVTEKK
jgi:signal transduction histidine kinase